MTDLGKRYQWTLVVIVACYLLFGWLYARETPIWQAPDEPAHFNYVSYVAENRRLPVLQAGDYPHDYLEQLKAAHFPPSLSVEPLRYESHQPPLYYLLAAVLYRTTAALPFDMRLLLLRLFSVVLGAFSLLALHSALGQIFPRSPRLQVIACAFVAVLPMRLAMTAAINNDTLAELLLLLLFGHNLRIVRLGPSTARAARVGALLGLLLLTKTTVYLQAGLLVLIAPLAFGSTTALRSRFKTGLCYGLMAILLALVVALPFFLRGASIYGWMDPLGWARHDSIVTGQLRTIDLLTEVGLPGLVQRWVVTTFRSFWGQFGWMGVLLDARIYRALALFTVIVCIGALQYTHGLWRRCPSLTASQKGVLSLSLLLAVASLATYVGYNLKFVQHQGRYLFPALGAISACLAAGLVELSQRRLATRLALGLLLAASALGLAGILLADVAEWTIVTLLLGALLVVANSRLPTAWRWAPPVALYTAFLALDWVCLFGFIVPMLLP